MPSNPDYAVWFKKLSELGELLYESPDKARESALEIRCHTLGSPHVSACLKTAPKTRRTSRLRARRIRGSRSGWSRRSESHLPPPPTYLPKTATGEKFLATLFPRTATPDTQSRLDSA